MGFEWTELTYQQILAGNTALIVFPICVLLAFLVLVAQYESWTLPLVVILIVPMCLLCALGGVQLSRGDNNIFTQIGLIVLVGLACKNAILIVEFAREREAAGDDLMQAILEACRLRLRPILMTSLAFVMGVAPLAISTGAGSEMRRAMGVAVFSGMLGVTLFGLVLTPVFYWTIRRLTGVRKRPRAKVPIRARPSRPAPSRIWPRGIPRPETSRCLLFRRLLPCRRRLGPGLAACSAILGLAARSGQNTSRLSNRRSP